MTIKCRLPCQDLMNRAQHIEVSFSKVSEQSNINYRCRLNASVIFLCYLTTQGLVFRGDDDSQRAEALDLLDIISKFEFAFVLHLMNTILGITHDLSQALQRKDQEIVNAIGLVKGAKTRLQLMRDNDWDTLLAEVFNFSRKHEIVVINLEDVHVARGRSKSGVEKIANLYHYRIELFYYVIDLEAQKLDHRFDEVNTKLLLCMTCFDPRDLVSTFDKNKLLRLAEFYPTDLSETVLLELDNQLDNFIVDMHLDDNFSLFVGI